MTADEFIIRYPGWAVTTENHCNETPLFGKLSAPQATQKNWVNVVVYPPDSPDKYSISCPLVPGVELISVKQLHNALQHIHESIESGQ